MTDTPTKTDLAAPAAIKPATLRELVTGDGMRQQFAMALPKVLPVERFIRTLCTTINRDPKLLECDRNSVLAGAMTAAQLGLEIDPALGRAYLLPYRDSRKGMIAQLIIGYKGFLDLFYRSGMAAGFQAAEVYERDTFRYRRGLNEILEHEPYTGDDDAGKLVAAYAIARLKDGGQVWEVATKRDILRARKASRGADSPYSPWNTAEGEMWKKTAIRKLSKLLPLSPELRDAIAVDDDSHDMSQAINIQPIDTTGNIGGQQ